VSRAHDDPTAYLWRAILAALHNAPPPVTPPMTGARVGEMLLVAAGGAVGGLVHEGLLAHVSPLHRSVAERFLAQLATHIAAQQPGAPARTQDPVVAGFTAGLGAPAAVRPEPPPSGPLLLLPRRRASRSARRGLHRSR